MYMSRLAALKEYTFMQALRREGFPVPEPIGNSRHTVIMSLVDAFPLRQISSVPDPAGFYAELISLIVKFAQYGLIHGDFNEFNILIEEKHTSTDPSDTNEEGEYTGPITLVPTVIDFPQMVSTSHADAAYYFDRDVACIKRYFSRRFGFTSDEPGPFLDQSLKNMVKRLDVEVEATGFSKKMAKELEKYMKEVGVDGDAGGVENGNDSEDEIPDMEDEDEELGEEDEVERDNEDPNVPDLVPAQQDASALASEMTVLEIQDNETEPAPSVADFKAQFGSRPKKPAKSAKAKAGWAI